MACIMNTNEEEKGNRTTVEADRAYFKIETTRFTILDASGHKSHGPNMTGDASQTDRGVLIIPAQKGGFELEHGDQ